MIHLKKNIAILYNVDGSRDFKIFSIAIHTRTQNAYILLIDFGIVSVLSALNFTESWLFQLFGANIGRDKSYNAFLYVSFIQFKSFQNGHR